MPGMVRWIMRIIVAGASGLLGTAISRSLRSAGHDVGTLVRRVPAAPSEFQWNPAEGSIDDTALKGADAVINLSGAGIGDRPWTRSRINELRNSRLGPTRTLAAAMGRQDTPPAVFLSQSGSNYYGNAGLALLRENAPAGDGVLARICADWEAAAHEAPAGVRVVTPRTGVVLSRSGGALGRLMPLLRLGVGGPLGNGRQYWPWVTLPDVAGAFGFLLGSRLSGPGCPRRYRALPSTTPGPSRSLPRHPRPRPLIPRTLMPRPPLRPLMPRPPLRRPFRPGCRPSSHRRTPRKRSADLPGSALWR